MGSSADTPDATHGADHGHGAARVAAGGGHDGASRPEFALFLSGGDDVVGDAILYAAAGVHELGLAEDLDAWGGRQEAEVHQGRVANEASVGGPQLLGLELALEGCPVGRRRRGDARRLRAARRALAAADLLRAWALVVPGGGRRADGAPAGATVTWRRPAAHVYEVNVAYHSG
eukprot:scaffold159289_cov37-Prasinocladus_malaysianus.AAC.1